jgi:hypothetical protein
MAKKNQEVEAEPKSRLEDILEKLQRRNKRF